MVPIRIALLGFDGCMASAVTGMLDTLAVANHWAEQLGHPCRFDTQVYSEQGHDVAASTGLRIPAVSWADAPLPDIVIVPPIMAPVPETLAQHAPAIAWLRDTASQGCVMASVCAGAFFLAEAGLLAGYTATTNPAFANLFRQRYPDVKLHTEMRLIDHGRMLFAGSTTAFLSLALHVAERWGHHEVAVLTAKTMAVDKNSESQRPYFITVAPKDHGDATIVSLQDWIEQNAAKPLSLADLTERSALSERSLHRRFVAATSLTPVGYIQRVRIESAKRLLEATDQSIEQITEQVGYEDPRGFSRLFKTQVGLSPKSYRERFGWRRPAQA